MSETEALLMVVQYVFITVYKFELHGINFVWKNQNGFNTKYQIIKEGMKTPKSIIILEKQEISAPAMV